MERDFSFRGVECSKAECDNCCWGAKKAKGELERLYFKMPALKENEVRMKILYSGLCHSDCFKIDQEWGPNSCFPLVPGHEIIGKIEKLGSKVTHLKIGDIVGSYPFRDCCRNCEFCNKGMDNLCFAPGDAKFMYDPYLGGYSTYLQVAADFAFPIPSKLPLAKSSPILCAGVTTYAPLKRWCMPGARCGIIGIGGLGHLAVQYANKLGMHVVAISTTAAKEKEAKIFGAKEFFVSKNEDHMKRLMGPEKLDLIVNTAYTPDITNYMQSLKPAGVFVQLALPEITNPFKFVNMDLVCGQKILTGGLVGSKKDAIDTLKFSEDFEVYPLVENYPWADLPKAYKRLHDGAAKYRCVIDVESTYDGKQF